MAARRKKPKANGAKKPDSPSPVKVEPFSQNLAVALTTKEIAERSDRAAHVMADRDHARVAFSEEKKATRTKINQMGIEIRSLLAEVREKVTYREVPCERRFIYAEKIVRDVRLDTGDTLTERPMSEQESQRELFDGNPPPAGGGDMDDEFDGGDDGE